ncbi:hypothetical protein LSAT2_026819, partial [Lamellibrachia satsuma]
SRMNAVIQQLATPCAADLMFKPLTVAKGLKCDVVEEEDMIVHMKINRKEGGQHSYDICYNPQNVNCTCEFFITQGLPCRHLFFLDIKRGGVIFEESWVLKRWLKAHRRAQPQVFCNGNIETLRKVTERKTLSPQEKFL